jgi:alpha-mannosidase
MGRLNMHFKVERINRILSELNNYGYTAKMPIASYKMKACGYGEYIQLNENSEGWKEFKFGERWGGRDAHFWFRTSIEIPAEYSGKAIVYQVTTGREGEWDALNPQFLVYVNNKPAQGLDVNHREVLLTESATEGEIFKLDLYAYGGMNEGLVELKSCVAVLDKEVEKLYYNIKVPLDVAVLLDREDKRRIDILGYLTEAVNKIDLRKPFNTSYYSSINDANNYLNDEFYSKYCGHSDVLEICVGHTHIDVAWLWTLAQTREKAARSFSTVLNLMKQYPEYSFMSSQPQLYKFVKEDYPEIYEEIKRMVKEGRWEPEGAMWLEADCNLTSGESLIRQIMFGKRFFKEEFGVDSKILWLPDVFGYSAALPQILDKSGVKYFMTTKISWNEYNKMPYDSFLWKGIDGTEVLTHFISTCDYENASSSLGRTTYNGNINPSQVMGCWQRYQHKDMSNEVLNCFGYGDGGGGATKEMLENAIRLEKGIPGAPRVKIGKAIDFFEKLESKVRNNKRAPKWVGELYLEYHRGTYTSIASNKKYNRKTEFLNLEAELLSTINQIVDKQYKYPQEQINACWETTLLNQFHDIIPGSSIKEVYQDSRRDYEKINTSGREIVNYSVKNIASKINLSETSIIVFNQLSIERNDIVSVDLPKGWNGAVVFDGKRELVSQKTLDNKILFYGEGIPSKGYKTFKICEVKNQPDYSQAIQINEQSFSNKYYAVKLDDESNIISIYDKINERQVLKSGERANVLQAFEDKPHNFDAWDINIYYQEKMWEINDVVSVQVAEKGPVRSCLEVKRTFLDSTLIQKIYIYNDLSRIDFSNWIDWKEKQILVKAAFPVDIHADKATYEIQYGNVERPTHWNTSWDYARFEVCAHKWADLSEGDYGVSLLNDCKYGYDIKDSVMRLTLLKSAAEPNVDADREIHEFNYSLYPHSGDWKNGRVEAMAYMFNCPSYAVIENAHSGILPEKLSFVCLNKENVIIEVVKKAEASEEIIIRMYECHNKRTKVKCSMPMDLEYAVECDLLENNLQGVPVESNSFEFGIKPYEIKSFKIKLK